MSWGGGGGLNGFQPGFFRKLSYVIVCKFLAEFSYDTGHLLCAFYHAKEVSESVARSEIAWNQGSVVRVQVPSVFGQDRVCESGWFWSISNWVSAFVVLFQLCLIPHIWWL